MTSLGLDFPSLVHLIKLDGNYSEATLAQQLGCVQRIYPGKKRGFLHIPMDEHHSGMSEAAGRMRDYFTVTGADIREAFL